MKYKAWIKRTGIPKPPKLPNKMKDIIKISILKDGDKYAYMEYQGGNDPKVYNNTYGSTGFYDLTDVLEDVAKTYGDEEFILSINI